MLWQNFNGYIAPEPRFPGAIHFAHAARTERRLNFIRPESCARGEGHPHGIMVPMEGMPPARL